MLYRGDITSKRKYGAIRSSLPMIWKEDNSGKKHIEFMENISVPRIMLYKKLLEQMNTVDIGQLHDVREELCEGMEDGDKVDGRYRDLLPLLLRLAKFYVC